MGGVELVLGLQRVNYFGIVHLLLVIELSITTNLCRDWNLIDLAGFIQDPECFITSLGHRVTVINSSGTELFMPSDHVIVV